MVHKIGQPHSRSPICLITSMIIHWIGQYEILLPMQNLCQFELFSNLKRNYLGMKHNVLLHHLINAEIRAADMYPKGSPHIIDLEWKVWLQYKGVGMDILQKPTIFILLMLYLSTTFINFHRAVQFTVHLTLPVCSHHSHQARLWRMMDLPRGQQGWMCQS